MPAFAFISRTRFIVVGTVIALGLAAAGYAQAQRGERDTHVVKNPGALKEDPKFVPPPSLGQPIYACSSAITVKNFIPGAKIEVFIDGAPAPNPSFIGTLP